MRTRLLFLAAFLLCAAMAQAQTNLVAISTTFAWDAVESEYDITYRLCHSTTTGVYDYEDCTDTTATTVTWTRVLGPGRHYFTVRAWAVIESQQVFSYLSNEVSLSLLPPTGGAAKVAP
jgi:hypothetical protein